MDLVIPTGDGNVEINFSWLPTWLGLNQPMLSQISSKMFESFVGRTIDAECIAQMNTEVIRLLCEEFSAINGLDTLLKALEHVRIEP